MPPWYLVMIAAGALLSLWIWWRTPQPPEDAPERIGRGVSDEAVTAFEDVARQIMSSERHNGSRSVSRKEPPKSS